MRVLYVTALIAAISIIVALYFSQGYIAQQLSSIPLDIALNMVFWALLCYMLLEVIVRPALPDIVRFIAPETLT